MLSTLSSFVNRKRIHAIYGLKPYINNYLKRFRKPSICDTTKRPLDPKPCFDINKMVIEHATPCHSKLIRSFLYEHYWPRLPSTVSLWIHLNSPYFEIMTEKYAHGGDRFLAFECIKRTGERRLVGLTVANKIYPWAIEEFDEWAHYTSTKPEKYRIYFSAHCLRSPDLFRKFNVNYIYEIEVVATASEVSGQGVGTLLLKNALLHGIDARHRLIQVIADSYYTSRMCEKCGMKRAWSMNYSDFVDAAGRKIFTPRRPHNDVSIYIQEYDHTIAKGEDGCRPAA